jgi:putative acetyltransferase
VIKENNNMACAAAIPNIRIRSFQPEDATAFRELNEEWITAYFGLEENDILTLRDPEGKIIRPGGHILMAFSGDTPVGCCALIFEAPGVFELAKMAVAREHRGQGIGRKLLEYNVERARALGARTLHLGSNSKLADAIHLYESLGFRHIPPEERAPSPYARANVFMRLQITAD